MAVLGHVLGQLGVTTRGWSDTLLRIVYRQAFPVPSGVQGLGRFESQVADRWLRISHAIGIVGVENIVESAICAILNCNRWGGRGSVLWRDVASQ